MINNKSDNFNFYEKGINYYKTRNYQNAFKMFNLAIDKGNVQALTEVGRCYELGLGVEKNLNKAVEYYEKAVAKDDPKGLYQLGICFLYGNGISKDINQALACLIKSSNHGFTKATFELGYIYAKGIVVKKDDFEAVKYFEQSALDGDMDSYMWLCYLYVYSDDLKNSYDKLTNYADKMHELYIKIKESHNNKLIIHADKIMAYLYTKDLVLYPDFNTAIKYYYDAYLLGDIDSSISIKYLFGNINNSYNNIRYNLIFNELKHKEKQHDSLCYVYLGIMYQNGILVRPNLHKAID